MYINDEIDEENEILLSKLNTFVTKYYESVESDFKQCKTGEIEIKNINKKYPHLKRNPLKKSLKKIEMNAFVHEILSYFRNDFTTDESNNIYHSFIKKVQGVFKHAQALKTGYCNMKIMNWYSELNTISVCITKGTLEANSQWVHRLIDDLYIRYPQYQSFEQIAVVSSKKDTLNGKVIHCKNLNDLWSLLKTRNNQIKIIIVCGNKTRISDVLNMSIDFQNLTENFKKNLRIFHDEAHNPKEGIPAYRGIVENIILQNNVLSYGPITATAAGDLSDETNNLWHSENLENNACNYINFDKTLSTDMQYSSCKKGTQISFESIKNTFRDFGITQIPKKTCRSVFNNTYDFKKIETKFESNDCEKEKKLYIKKKQILQNTSFFGNEIEAVNNGLNVLNFNNIFPNFFNNYVLNIHVISTPLRKIITRYLAEEALKKDYNPIVLAIYGEENNKYHLMYDTIEEEVSNVMGKGEFNKKIQKIFEYLKNKNVNTLRPFIFIGNYSHTGESLTYVSSDYGILKSNTKLISTNPEDDYQVACRSNFMTTRFFENDHNWVEPEKFLVGPEKFIKNALWYEELNDKRILNFSTNTEIQPSVIINTNEVNSTNGTVAIPIKIKVDFSDDTVKKLLEIIEKPKRSNQDKVEFLRILKICIDDPEKDCKITDKTGKFDINTFNLINIRSYKKISVENETSESWRFKSYEDNFKIGTGYINNKTKMDINECEILTCMENYTLKDNNGNVIYRNLKSVWWMGYKY